MRAVEGMTGELHPLWVALAAALAFAIASLFPRLAGAQEAQPDLGELPAGARPRRQWAVAGFGITSALCLPLVFFGGDSREAGAVALLTLLGGFAGLANDLLALPHLLQVPLLLAIAAVGISQHIAITEVKVPFAYKHLALGAWSVPLTLVWMLGVVYAVILCRRLPKLTAGLVTVIAATMGSAALLVGPSRSAPVAGLLGLILAATGAGAWRRSYPSLGSAAHWALGFALASLTILGMLKNTAFLLVGVPLLTLGVPVSETTYAIVYGGRTLRLTLGPRREVLHEALGRLGLSAHRTVLLFQAATVYLCAVALLLVFLASTSFIIKLALLTIMLALGSLLFFMAARIAAAPRETEEAQVDMLGVPIHRIDMAGALARVEGFIRERSPHMVVTSDGSAIVRAQQDSEYRAIVRASDMVTADGRGLVWMARVLGLSVTDRVPGVDMMDRLCELAAERGYSVYLVGALPGVASDAARAMQGRYPGLRVAGTHHGYFSPEEEPGVVAAIAAARPDILFVAFGAPRQEKWIRRHLDQLGAPVAIGVGGSFDVLAGRVPRAPAWMQQAGLEWLYRVLREPRRLRRLWALPRLVWITLRAALGRRG